MPANTTPLLKRVRKNVRTRLMSGMLILVPFGVTLLVMQWLFNWMAGILRRPVHDALFYYVRNPAIWTDAMAVWVNIVVSLISILILLVLLYLIGAVGHYVTGEKLLAMGESLLLRIPLVRTVYSASKQVIQAVSLPDRSAFKSVVLVEVPRPGYKALAFMTGYIHDPAGRKCCKVYVPSALNPTSGFLQIIPVEEVVPVVMTIEEAFKILISGGIISPEELVLGKLDP